MRHYTLLDSLVEASTTDDDAKHIVQSLATSVKEFIARHPDNIKGHRLYKALTVRHSSATVYQFPTLFNPAEHSLNVDKKDS